jgi:hypothetical protein
MSVCPTSGPPSLESLGPATTTTSSTALSAAGSFSTAGFFSIAGSLAAAMSAAFLAVVAATSPSNVVIDSLPLDPPGTVTATIFRIGCAVGAYFGACCPDSGTPSTMDPSLQTSLILFTREIVPSDDVLVSLDGLEADLDSAIFSFPLPGPLAVSAPPPAGGHIRPGNLHTTRRITPLL